MKFIVFWRAPWIFIGSSFVKPINVHDYNFPQVKDHIMTRQATHT